jgi:cytochrome P450
MVIAGLLGVPEADQQSFSAWSHDITDFLGAGRPDAERAAAADRALGEFRAYLTELIAEARAAARQDLLGTLLRGADGDEPLTDDELLATCVTLIFAGHETTANLVSNAVVALLETPAQLQALRDDPSLMERAIEETLRYNGSVQRVRRIATEDLELGGRLIARGDAVLNFVGSADRDERAFDDPDRFDIGRTEGRHLAFGYGPHFCVGAALARMEAPIMLAALLERFPSIRLTAPVRWWENIVFRGPAELLVELA